MKNLFQLVLLLGSTMLLHAQTPLQFKDHLISDDYQGWWGRCLSDVNKDGLLDLVVLKQSRGYGKVNPGWLGWYEAKDGGKTWVKHVIDNNDLYGSGDLAAADMDRDGDIDIMAFEADETNKDTSARMYWYENLDGGKAPQNWKRHYIDVNPEFVKDVELADFNKDGKLDIATIVFGREKLEIHLQKGKDKWTKALSMKVPNLHEGLSTGDIDGDGDLDLATCGYWVENPGRSKKTSWILHNINEKWHNQSPSGGMEWRRNATKTFCYDLNKDGKAEVFISHSESNRDGYPVAWYEAKDPKGPWTEHVIAPNYKHCHTLQVFDFDQDGDPDVLAGEIPEHPTQKRVRIFLNKGNNLDWEEFIFSNEGIYNGLVGDLEGDGDPDIFTAPGFSNAYPQFKVFINQKK
jgi:hypothetical protein